MAVRHDPGALLWGTLLGLLAAAVGLVAGASPALAIAGAVGIAFVLIAFANLAAGLALFVVVSFVEVLPVGGTLSGTKIAGLLLALSWLAVMTTRSGEKEGKGDIISAQPLLVGLLVLFFAWTLVSATWAEIPASSVELAYRYALNFVLFGIVFTAFQVERRAVDWVVLAFVAGAVASALYGMIAPGAAAEVFSGEGEPTRLTGAGIDPNGLATVLVGGLTLAVGLVIVSKRNLGLRTFAVFAVALCAFGVLLTLSRAGLLALAAAIIAGALLASRRKGAALALAVLVIGGVIMYFTALATPEARERVTSVGTGSGRTDIWTVGWRMASDHIAVGVGAGNFSNRTIEYALEPGLIDADVLIAAEGVGKVAHNIYLETVAELGVVGLAMLLAIFAYCLRATGLAVRNFARSGDQRMETLARAMLAAQIGTLVAAMFASIQISKQLWLLMAMGPAMLALSQQLRSRAPL